MSHGFGGTAGVLFRVARTGGEDAANAAAKAAGKDRVTPAVGPARLGRFPSAASSMPWLYFLLSAACFAIARQHVWSSSPC